MLPPGLQTVFKPMLYARKAAWEHVTLSGVPLLLKSLRPKDFLNGKVAIWLTPVFTNGRESYPWLVLDVEDLAQHKTSIAANIEAGRQLLRLLCEHGLEVGLIIFLTGNGLRFNWPYLVPKDLRSAFKLWVKDSKNYPWIDPGPFKAKVPMRILGNRNHPSQGGVLSRHVHRLENIHDLWFLTKDEYLEKVSGVVDLDTSSRWLSGILPTDFLPEPWKAFLEQYQVVEALSQSIYRPILPQKKYRKPVSEIADRAGLEYKEHQFAHGEVLKLEVCPICGRKDGNPYVTQAGRLKCYHKNSCAAGAVDEQDSIIGLPLGEWMQGIDDAGVYEQEPEQEHIERITVGAARAALCEALQGNADACVSLSPGAGKSHTTTQNLVGDLQGFGKVAIATPEHRLSSEIYGLARKMADEPGKVFWLKGRDVENCSRITKIQQVAEAGFSPGAVVCPSCPEKSENSCEYWNQFESLKAEERGLWLMTHAMSIEIPLSKYGIDLLVVDESPVKSFLQKSVSNVGAMQMIQSKLSSDGRAAMGKLLSVVPKQLEAMQAAGAKKYDLSRLYAGQAPEQSHWSELPGLWSVAGISDGERDRLMSDLAMFQRWEDRGDGKPETTGQWHKRLYYDERVDLTSLNWLWSALERIPGTYVRFQKDPRNPAQFVSFTKKLPQHEGRIICLDATGSLTEAENLFGRQFQLISGKVEMPGLRTAWVKQAGGKIKMSRMTDRQIVAMLEKAATFLQTSDTEVLIATHMAVEETVRRLAEKILPGRNIHTCHYFGGSRGVNEFQDCTAVIALGTPFPSVDGVLDHAMALAPEPDKRLEWVSEAGTNELIQALHRIRPIKGNRTVVVCGRDFPVKEFGQPQFKINRQRGNKAVGSAVDEIVDRLSPFVERFRFVTKEIAWMHKICQAKDKAKAIQVFENIKKMIVEAENSARNPLILLDETPRAGKGNIFSQVYLLRDYILGKLDSKYSLIRPYATHPYNSTWDVALEILATRFELPKLTVSGRTYNFKKTTGIGYLSDVRDFYELVGGKFEPKSWSGIERKGDIIGDECITD